MNGKTIAILVVVVIVVAAVGAAIALNPGNEEKKTGGLYALDADIIYVDMGGISATPKMVVSIEQLYEQVYGDEVKKGLTIKDAKADTAFWKLYCDYDPIVTVNNDGTYTVEISSLGYETRNVTVHKADRMLSMGTMYMTTLYYFICEKYGVEPYSDAAKNSAKVREEFQKVVAGGTDLAYVNENTELKEYFDTSKYLDAGQHTIGDYDFETLAKNTESLTADGSNVVLIATGKSVDKTNHDRLESTLKTHGGEEVLFLTASDIKNSFANIEALGYIFGYGGYNEKLIEDLQLRLYVIYSSLKDHPEEHKVYWESTFGSAVRSTGMSKSVMDFMGWNTSMLKSGEIDTETILNEKPDILVYYTNDGRSLDEKMRYV
jgi:ABC-type Fe3+-hydroxamate transport system substrate-binding protein